MQAIFVQDGELLDYTPAGAVTGGDVVVVGSVPLIAKNDIAASALGAAACEGVFDVVKDTSTFSDGDAVYWNATGSPNGGTASSGAATSTASGANLMGFAVPMVTAGTYLGHASGDATVRVKLTTAKRTVAIAGSMTADDITGSDSSLGITGAPPATTSSAGGAVATAGGIGGSVSGAGGAVSNTGGAGTLNAAGGVSSVVGGAGNGSGAGGVGKTVT